MKKSDIILLIKEVVAEKTLTKKEKQGLKRLEKKVPKKPFKKQYGKEGEKVYYATLTKQAKEKY